MILDSTTKVVRAVLSGAPATTNPDWNVAWADHKPKLRALRLGHNFGVLNGTTIVTIVAAPATVDIQRQIRGIWIYNADTASVTITVDVYDGTNARGWVQFAVPTLKTLSWEPGKGWSVTT